MKDGKPEEALKYFRDAQKIQENFRAGWWDTQALYYARVDDANCLLALGKNEDLINTGYRETEIWNGGIAHGKYSWGKTTFHKK